MLKQQKSLFGGLYRSSKELEEVVEFYILIKNEDNFREKNIYGGTDDNFATWQFTAKSKNFKKDKIIRWKIHEYVLNFEKMGLKFWHAGEVAHIKIKTKDLLFS